MSRLNLVDRIRVRTVCKKWQIPFGEISAMDKRPWAVNYMFIKYQGKVLTDCFLYDPHYQRYYKSECEIKLKHGENIVGGTVCASKYGWLLVSKEHNDTTCFMFYNPFRKEAIGVPDLGFRLDVATFSLSPTCLDYLIFASHHVNGGSLAFSVYHNEDKEWRMQVFEEMYVRILDVVYLDGVFYCFLNCARLGALRVADHKWSWFGNSVPDGMIETRYNVLLQYGMIKTRCNVHLFAIDGHLLLVIIDNQVCKNVIKFYWSKMTWETAKDMGNRTLFLGPTSYSTSTIEETGNLPRCCNYCEYHMKHTFNDMEKEDENLQYWEIYGQEKPSLRLCWINPTFEILRTLVPEMTDRNP